MDPVEPHQLRDALLPWFASHQRTMPWRSAPSPYHVLLSEVMLQQTRVDTVVPYFQQFTARWPTLEALASAHEDEVLTAWAGLGYYRRARNLLAAARAAVEAGGLVGDVDALRSLPGIGAYTAGAIASIAFGVPTAAVDGNVERVISRVDGLVADPKSGAGHRAIAARVGAITAPGAASEVTQGLMELGALVCTPREPRCGDCPWSALCVARAEGVQAELPRLRPRTPPTPVQGVAGVLRRGGEVLMGRRPPGLLGGMWEPVMAEAERCDEATLVEVFGRRAGVSVDRPRELGRLTHVFSHRRLSLTVFAVDGPKHLRLVGDGSYDALAFVDPSSREHAVSKLARKVLALASM